MTLPEGAPARIPEDLTPFFDTPHGEHVLREALRNYFGGCATSAAVSLSSFARRGSPSVGGVDDLPDRMLSTEQVLAATNVSSRSTIWSWEKSGKFPKRRRLPGGRNGWLQSEVVAWLMALPQGSDPSRSPTVRAHSKSAA